MADLTGDGVDDVLVVNGAGDILWRKGRPQEPGTFDPPITINPGHPSRDIVAVDTNQGPVLASVDATDNAVSLYAWRDGSFVLIGSLPTGSLPAQIATADLTGDGWDDLVVRNAGDGTLSVYFNTGSESGATGTALFPSPVTLPVGPGVSDVTLADVSGDGRTDIVVTNKLTGEVGVLRNLGHGAFAPAVLYPAGSGLYAVTTRRLGDPHDPGGDRGRGRRRIHPGRPSRPGGDRPRLQHLQPAEGAGGRPLRQPGHPPHGQPGHRGPRRRPRRQWHPGCDHPQRQRRDRLSRRRPGGLPARSVFTIAAGPDPTGMTVADVNGDGKPDLLVGNAYGDLLVLLGNGDGTFQPLLARRPERGAGGCRPREWHPRLHLRRPGARPRGRRLRRRPDDVGGRRSRGLLAPGAVALADLNGDGIPDLIVANSGSNNVLVYPGLGNGQFGPELNGGKGFFTGTDPVGITVANLGNGRPDLVIANKGSNDVSILLNEATANGGFTFVPGPRLNLKTARPAGDRARWPRTSNGDGIPDLLVSDSGSNQVRLLPGVGGGFFNDQNPTIFSVGNQPRPDLRRQLRRQSRPADRQLGVERRDAHL